MHEAMRCQSQAPSPPSRWLSVEKRGQRRMDKSAKERRGPTFQDCIPQDRVLFLGPFSPFSGHICLLWTVELIGKEGVRQEFSIKQVIENFILGGGGKSTVGLCSQRNRDITERALWGLKHLLYQLGSSILFKIRVMLLKAVLGSVYGCHWRYACAHECGRVAFAATCRWYVHLFSRRWAWFIRRMFFLFSCNFWLGGDSLSLYCKSR